jgi:hypothetical protein
LLLLPLPPDYRHVPVPHLTHLMNLYGDSVSISPFLNSFSILGLSLIPYLHFISEDLNSREISYFSLSSMFCW